jgi:O-succinylhomoserine sulfhydrylase
VLAFELDGGEAVAFALLNNLQLIDISINLGDSKLLACHPYTTTHSSMSPQDRASFGISPDIFACLSAWKIAMI